MMPCWMGRNGSPFIGNSHCRFYSLGGTSLRPSPGRRQSAHSSQALQVHSLEFSMQPSVQGAITTSTSRFLFEWLQLVYGFSSTIKQNFEYFAIAVEQ